MIFEAEAGGRHVRVEVRGGPARYQVSLDGRALDVDFQQDGSGLASLLIDGRSYEVGVEPHPGGYTIAFGDDVIAVELSADAPDSAGVAHKPAGGPSRLTAPMPGKIVRVLAVAGQELAAGQGVVVMEAMKMENELRSPRAGRVQELHVREGQAVETGALLVVVG